MKILNRAFRFLATVAVQLAYSLGLYFIGLSLSGIACTVVYAFLDFTGRTAPVGIGKSWILLSLIVWAVLEVYVAVKVIRLRHIKRDR